MSYIAVSEVDDENASKKVKALLATLAYTVDYNGSAHEKQFEYKELIGAMKGYLGGIGKQTYSQAPATSIQAQTTKNMQAHIQSAEAQIVAIDKTVQFNIGRQKHLHRALVNDGFYAWRDRSFVVSSYGKSESFQKKNHRKTDQKYDTFTPVFLIDNKAVAEAFVEDFKKCLPSSVPMEAFSLQLVPDRTGAWKKGVSLIVAFNQTYEDAVKGAFVKLTELNLSRMKENGDEAYQEIMSDKPNDQIGYKDAEYLVSYMPYFVETEPTNHFPGNLTMEALRSANPLESLKDISLQEQYPLLNINRYAENDKLLHGFLNESFGGSIGRNQGGYRRAMHLCMGHYVQEDANELEVEKVLSSIDRKMNVKDRRPDIENGM